MQAISRVSAILLMQFVCTAEPLGGHLQIQPSMDVYIPIHKQCLHTAETNASKTPTGQLYLKKIHCKACCLCIVIGQLAGNRQP